MTSGFTNIGKQKLREGYRAAVHDSIMDAHAYLLSALRVAMVVRKEHPNDWIEFERQAITDAANRWRVHQDRWQMWTPITVDQVEAIEHFAVGHSDYASKLALYVAELIHGVREIQP